MNSCGLAERHKRGKVRRVFAARYSHARLALRGALHPSDVVVGQNGRAEAAGHKVLAALVVGRQGHRTAVAATRRERRGPFSCRGAKIRWEALGSIRHDTHEVLLSKSAVQVSERGMPASLSAAKPMSVKSVQGVSELALPEE